MRFLVRRIYRAFPELDRYSDEQCLRFVAATGRRFWTKLAHRAIIGAVTLAAFVGAAVACVFVTSKLEHYQDAVRRDLPWLELGYVLGCAPVVAIVPVAGFITRDLLLRRRVRYVLRTRSACPGCGYRLIGLSVSPGHTITCPECGLVCGVDPSLSELELDAAGREQLHPAIIAPRWRFWTARRRRLALRVLLLVVLPPALLAGGYEVWLRHQASVAARERLGVAGLAALVESSLPAGDGTANGWDHVAAALDAVRRADGRVWSTSMEMTSDGRFISPDPALIYSRGVAGPQDELEQKSKALALRMMGEYRAEGVPDHLKRAAACPRAWRTLVADPDQSMAVMRVDFGQARDLGKINGARMALAAKDGNTGEYLEALEQSLALSRMLQHQALLIDSLMAYWMDKITLRRVQLLLATHPDAETLASIAQIMRRQDAGVKRSHFLEGDRIFSLDHVAWYFSDPARVRWGKYTQGFKAQLGGMGSAVRLGTYVENRDALKALFEVAEKAADQVPADRVALHSYPLPDLFWVRNLGGALDQLLSIQDGHETDVRGVRLLVALERFRAEHGDYPAALTELVPGYIGELPLDVWSGKPFHYVRVDPKADRLGRWFLLYSVGADGADDGGKEQAVEIVESWRTRSGTDFVVNRWDDVVEP